MVKLALRALQTNGCWTSVLVVLLLSGGPLATRVFAQTAAGTSRAGAAKKAPKTTQSKPAKKAGATKSNKATAPALPAKEKIQPVTSGLRDPFRLPEPPKAGPEGGIDTGSRPPGPRGLAVNEMILEGIVREDTNNTMIAVVAGSERRAYFLRVNDPVYHATVAKITTDSVYFTETFTDPAGHESTREVVKKMPATGEKP